MVISLMRFLVLIVLFFGGACSNKYENISPKELVLLPDSKVDFVNVNGSGSVRYIAETTRAVTLVGMSEFLLHCTPRTEEFRGEWGIYNPGTNTVFNGNDRIRVVYRESNMYFQTSGQLNRFLISGSNVSKWVWNSEGIMVGYSSTPHRNQISISLYRLYLNDLPVKNLDGYNNDAVKYPTSGDS